MKLEDVHESLARFNDPELPEDEKAELLINLKDGLSSFYDEHDKVTAEKEKLKERNSQLQQANAQYFLKLGVQEQSQQEEEATAQETFSKTVKLSDLLKNKGV
ncbi:head scaffolding protein [Bacillus phage Karezi]|uniref:Scaffold protein n=1 Tax=Bacillus phage Karezi TaxID=2591398 RepID=A0A514AAP4_9CAUD|nr:head scaffolding protein [Bacillus phage Karezi]QDH50336.1 scaffold protein [Bacillus phage Karezi]